MITIFTPVYNRAYIIKKLYCSLLQQTCHKFEWLVVDDGSTDSITEVMHQWVSETQQFNIRFYSQKNGGKHRAINYGVKLAKYDLFFIVDSDDYLEEDAVETVIKYWKEITDDHNFAGIAGLKRYDNGNIIGGEPYFKEYVDVTNFERKRYGLTGDKAEVYKTDILRKFPFPEYVGEKFITEAVVWDRIAADGYMLRWINKVFMVCNYLPDGLTAKGKQIFEDNPKGWAHYIRNQREWEYTRGKRQYLKDCYLYFETEHTTFTERELKDLLGLHDEELEIIKKQYIEFSMMLRNICIDKKICIYAFGRWGKRLKRYLDNLGIQISYVIDKQYMDIKEAVAYSIDMELPEVDLVIIALKEGADEAAEAVAEKLPGAMKLMLSEMKPDLW